MLPPADFDDMWVVAAGECGYSSRIHFEIGGVIRVLEVGWDLTGCFDFDEERQALKRVLEAVTTGRVRADGRVILSGPLGDVVLGR